MFNFHKDLILNNKNNKNNENNFSNEIEDYLNLIQKIVEKPFEINNDLLEIIKQFKNKKHK